MDFTKLSTPPACVADFCLIPVRLNSSSRTQSALENATEGSHIEKCARLTWAQIGTPTASVSNEVAAVQRLMKASGLSYSMHSGKLCNLSRILASHCRYPWNRVFYDGLDYALYSLENHGLWKTYTNNLIAGTTVGNYHLLSSRDYFFR